jgi:hypothetical protein
MTLPHFQNIKTYDNCENYEPAFKNLYEFNIKNDTVSTNIISYLNENTHTYSFKENINKKILKIITNAIDTVVNNTNKKFHIRISMHNKQGFVYHIIEDDFILYNYKFDQAWEDDGLINIEYTFVKNKKSKWNTILKRLLKKYKLKK